MSKEPNNIDRLVREKLDGFEMTPPPSAWETTASSLNSIRKRGIIFWFALGLAAFAILGTSVYFFSMENEKDTELALLNEGNQSKNFVNNNSVNEDKNGATFKNPKSEENNSNSNDELNNDRENTIDEANGISDKDLNRNRSYSGINSSMIQDKITARERQIKQKNQSKKDNALKQQEDGGNSSMNNDSTDQASNDAHSRGSDKDRNSDSFSDKSTSNDGDKSKDEQFENSDSGNSTQTEDYSLLSTAPIEPLTSVQPTHKSTKLEEAALPVSVPFWKAFSIEASLGGSTFNNFISNNPVDSNTLMTLNNAANRQRSFDVRFGVNYHLTDRLSFQTGIHYNSLKEDYTYESHETTTYFYNDTISFSVDTASMDTTFVIDYVPYDSTSVVSKTVENSYKIFTLPFQFAWTQPISPRSSLEFSVGGALSLFGKNKGTVLVDSANYAVEAESGYHTSGMLSLGGSLKYLYRFGMHHSVYVEPWAQFGVSNQSTPILNYNSLRRRYGIRIGYRFYF